MEEMKAHQSNSLLVTRHCVPCAEGTTPLKGDSITTLANRLGDQWRVEAEHHLEREFRFSDFRSALVFVNQVAAIAEAEGHHPEIYLAWGKVRVTIWTHKIGGLSESDFILAAKIGAL